MGPPGPEAAVQEGLLGEHFLLNAPYCPQDPQCEPVSEQPRYLTATDSTLSLKQSLTTCYMVLYTMPRIKVCLERVSEALKRGKSTILSSGSLQPSRSSSPNWEIRVNLDHTWKWKYPPYLLMIRGFFPVAQPSFRRFKMAHHQLLLPLITYQWAELQMSMRPVLRTLTRCTVPTRHGAPLQVGAWENAARPELLSTIWCQPNGNLGCHQCRQPPGGTGIFPRHRASLLRVQLWFRSGP